MEGPAASMAVSEEKVTELRRSGDFFGDIIERRFERDPDAWVVTDAADRE